MIIFYAIKELLGIAFAIFIIPVITVLLIPLMFLYQVTKPISKHISNGLAFCMDRLLDLSEWTAENCILHRVDRDD